MVLLDASALIVALYNEPGADTVAAHLGDAAVVTVNLEEVAGKLLRDGIDIASARSIIDVLDIDVFEFTEPMAWRAAELRRLLPPGVGIAARSCLAAASVLGVAVITADTAWTGAGSACGVQIVTVR